MTDPLVIGRYELHGSIASGSLAEVHLGRLLPAGLSPIVVIKRFHPELARDDDLARRLVDSQAPVRLVKHVNVVKVLDVVRADDELLLVEEYRESESLAALLRVVRKHGHTMPIPVVRTIGLDVMAALGAAHDATDAEGDLLEVIHGGLTPDDVLVGSDGFARVKGFGVTAACAGTAATSSGHARTTGNEYRAPELRNGDSPVGVETDLYSAAAVLWEMLCGKGSASSDRPPSSSRGAPLGDRPSATGINPAISEDLERLMDRGLATQPDERFIVVSEMAKALEATGHVASREEVAELVKANARERLARRSSLVDGIEDPEAAIPSNRAFALIRDYSDPVSSNGPAIVDVASPHVPRGGRLGGLVSSPNEHLKERAPSVRPSRTDDDPSEDAASALAGSLKPATRDDISADILGEGPAIGMGWSRLILVVLLALVVVGVWLAFR